MSVSWMSLLPPLGVLAVALTTKRVLLALCVGIVGAALIVSHGSPAPAGYLIGERIYGEIIDPTHLATFGFLLALGILIQIMTHTGGMAAYTRYMQQYLRSKKSVEYASLFVSTTFFIDDYLSNLTVGSIMRPLTDQFRIARVKLAFLVDSLSGPLCILVPATSWMAFILSTMQSAGINDPFALYLQTIPYLFYPLFIVATAWFVVTRAISFGEMKRHEEIAEKTGNLFGGATPPSPQQTTTQAAHDGSIGDFLVPIGTLLLILICGILYTGDSWLMGGKNALMQVMQQANTLWVLCAAGVGALVASIIFSVIHHAGFMQRLPLFVYDGMNLMKNSLLLLIGAWTLGALIKQDLHTGAYLATVCLQFVSAISLPLVVGITAALISASSGSVWGTIAIMIPLIVPVAESICIREAIMHHDLLLQVLGAVLSGAVAGSHLSPIADTMVTTSLSTGCVHLDHVRTQVSYALPAMISASISCLIASTLLIYGYPDHAALLSLFVGLLVLLGMLTLKNNR